jgi:hypothetical protein
MPATVSVVISNHNYARFLHDAIESCLEQDYVDMEIIVVDDGSTDRSDRVIRDFGELVVPIYKRQGGQTSALNTGYQATVGNIVIFLDADDTLGPGLVQAVAERFRDPDVVKVHWRLTVTDANGTPSGALKPPHELPEGDLRDLVLAHGPEVPVWPPTSGNAWSRRFLGRVLPLKELEHVLGIGSASADATLAMLAPFHGRVSALPGAWGTYRVHGENDHATMPFESRLRRDLALFEHRLQLLVATCGALGYVTEPERWRRESWFHRLAAARQTLLEQIPPRSRFLVVDDGQWILDEIDGRHAIPFPGRDGVSWGAPHDDDEARRELEQERSRGIRYLVIGWPSFWWLEHYTSFLESLRVLGPPPLVTPELVLFDLGLEDEAGSGRSR